MSARALAASVRVRRWMWMKTRVRPPRYPARRLSAPPWARTILSKTTLDEQVYDDAAWTRGSDSPSRLFVDSVSRRRRRGFLVR